MSEQSDQPLESEGPYGGFHVRGVAFLIDAAIILGGFLLGVVALTTVFLLIGTSPDSDMPGFVTWLLPVWAISYWAISESSARFGTLGKQVVGLQVVDKMGNRIGRIRGAVRGLGKIVSYIPLGAGYLLAVISPRKRTLHDLIAGTFVIRGGCFAPPMPEGDKEEGDGLSGA